MRMARQHYIIASKLEGILRYGSITILGKHDIKLYYGKVTYNNTDMPEVSMTINV